MSRPVIKAPECPEELAPGSVVLDCEGYAWQRFSEDRWFGQPGRVAASFRWPQLLADRGDLTVVHDAGAEDLDESTFSQQAHVNRLIDTVTAYRLAVHKHLGLGARPLDEHFDSELLGLLRATMCPSVQGAGGDVEIQVRPNSEDPPRWHWRIRGLPGGKTLAAATDVFETEHAASQAAAYVEDGIRNGRVAFRIGTEPLSEKES